MDDAHDLEVGSGSGSRLPTAVLTLAGVSSLLAVLISGMSIYLQLKNYRKPGLQRMVVRIMLMVPIYAVSSFISLVSLEAAVVIDAVRDIYEAFVIYCFFVLLLLYLGGERSLLILLHGRPPKEPIFPASVFQREIDVSDPYTFLFLKRGILQYVQVKPALAVATVVLKAVGKFNEGSFRVDSGYLYVSIVYNVSICLALYCLAMFWLVGILFFSFWQAIGISILVSAGAIKSLGPYTDAEHISLGLTDTLICVEMPFFAVAHMFAFSHTDFIDNKHSFVARMPFYFAFRDAFGLRDVVADSKATLRGEGMDYREFEPSEGFMHQGIGRERRIQAGLRYSQGGKRKYWLPRPVESTQPPSKFERGVNNAITRVAGRYQGEEVHAPLLARDAEDIVHLAPDMGDTDEGDIWGDPLTEGGYELPFGDIDEADEELFNHSRRYLFGDYNYPCIDVSSEAARVTMWDEEERVLRDERGAWFSPLRGAKGQTALDQRGGPVWEGYGAIGTTQRQIDGATKGKGKFQGVVPHITERLIDHDSDRAADERSGADSVKLNWTKAQRNQSKGLPRPVSEHRSKGNLHPHVGTMHSHPSSAESSNGSEKDPRVRAASISRSHSGSPAKSLPKVLPSDAVDLVVEDNHAAQEDRIQERRKGEPAITGSSLRKVYRKGFVTEDDAGRRRQGEVEVEDPTAGSWSEDARSGRVDAGEVVWDAFESNSGGHASNHHDTPRTSISETPDLEGTIARTQTPPLHARVYMDGVDNNPWA
ncbi:Organic solute transporter subunit alpha/Transmembrane protein 184 [Pleurotus pulmonarius]